MTKISGNQAAQNLISSLESLFNKGQASFSPHQHLTFVCGKRPSTDPADLSLRTQFLSYLEGREGNTILPILAEKAIDEFLDAGVDAALELGSFENLIAACVDSILLFPESEGSFAELGFFAANPEVIKKTLIANRDEYQGNSFINLGLMPIYNRESKYKPMLIIGDDLKKAFDQIVERLELNSVSSKYRKRFPQEQFKQLSPKNQLIAVYELIRALRFVTEENLFAVIGLIFKSYDLETVHRLLALLVAMSYVDRNQHGDYIVKHEAPALLSYNDDLFDKARAQVSLYYRKHDADAFGQMGGA